MAPPWEPVCLRGPAGKLDRPLALGMAAGGARRRCRLRGRAAEACVAPRSRRCQAARVDGLVEARRARHELLVPPRIFESHAVPPVQRVDRGRDDAEPVQVGRPQWGRGHDLDVGALRVKLDLGEQMSRPPIPAQDRPARGKPVRDVDAHRPLAVFLAIREIRELDKLHVPTPHVNVVADEKGAITRVIRLVAVPRHAVFRPCLHPRRRHRGIRLGVAAHEVLAVASPRDGVRLAIPLVRRVLVA